RPAGLRMVLLGGAAPPRSLIAALEDEFGIEFRHGWGMTETSPLGTVNTLSPRQRTALGSTDEQVAFQTKQGRPPYGVELRVVSRDGHVQPHDGEAIGELQVRGP
ncbi:MAG: AMP-binding protein, partial [Gammaproteobacteria bacterium]|nr:long-chain fatty acid--CoA ligase [Gemmatimonadota bacterium]NIU74063.1 AMP-binding protein [Gammaproteobacteria bacterium]NIY08356.1 AMP-binding protein [Gemmatimonadota bacterium]